MKPVIIAGVAALALLCAANISSAAGAPFASVSQDAPSTSDDPHWFDSVVGRKLVAVDGSTLLLFASESGLSLDIVGPDGNARGLSFTYLTDALGSVSDGNASKAVGVFRQAAGGVQIDFADGHSEVFAANPDGGVSMTLSDSGAKSYCMSWYPEGHVFGETDRKAALAAYASRLGLAQPAAQKAPKASCASAISTETIAHPRAHRSRTDAREAQASPQTILVRASEVHLIDAEPPAPAPIMQPVQAVQQVASVSAPGKPAPANRGASTCLSIDSDGANWGFRNGCAYNVQVAYCLINGNDKSTACGSGTGLGNVAANGFVSVLSNSAIVSADQEFRWIGCTGGANEVEAHLDRADPPAGRCVALRAS